MMAAVLRGINMGGSIRVKDKVFEPAKPVAAVSYSEFERLRRLVPERPDWHLNNWGLWRRSEQFTVGYEDHSVGLETMGGCAAEESSDHLWERNLGDWAEASNAVIEGLGINHRMIISNVYEASVLNFPKRVDVGALLAAAAVVFWERAQKRGLV